METIYIETTIVSYLVAKPSRDLILAAHQKITQEWWREERENYRCVTSEEVLREVSLGDPAMSRRRVETLAEIAVLAAEVAREFGRRSLGRAACGGGHVASGGLPVDLELPASGQPAFAKRAADIHGRAQVGVAGNLHAH